MIQTRRFWEASNWQLKAISPLLPLPLQIQLKEIEEHSIFCTCEGTAQMFNPMEEKTELGKVYIALLFCNTQAGLQLIPGKERKAFCSQHILSLQSRSSKRHMRFHKSSVSLNKYQVITGGGGCRIMGDRPEVKDLSFRISFFPLVLQLSYLFNAHSGPISRVLLFYHLVLYKGLINQ